MSKDYTIKRILDIVKTVFLLLLAAILPLLTYYRWSNKDVYECVAEKPCVVEVTLSDVSTTDSYLVKKDELSDSIKVEGKKDNKRIAEYKLSKELNLVERDGEEWYMITDGKRYDNFIVKVK